MHGDYKDHLSGMLDGIRDAGLYKNERQITTPQGARVGISDGSEVINLCANNYLGLSQHPEVNAAAMQGLKDWGYGMASVRFICGTQTLHKQLEEVLSDFLGPKTLFFTQAALTPMVVCMKPFSVQKTRCSQMSSITLASLTGFDSLKRNGTASRTTIWKTLKPS